LGSSGGSWDRDRWTNNLNGNSLVPDDYPAWTPNRVRHFQPGEVVTFRGPGGCYVRPLCVQDGLPPHYNSILKGKSVVCQGHYNIAPQDPRFQWRAHPSRNANNRYRGYVSFENVKSRGKYLCLTTKKQSWVRAPFKAYFAGLRFLKCKSCTWSVKQVKVFNRRRGELADRFVFINRKHKGLMLRMRQPSVQRQARPLYAAQNYMSEARVDNHGAFDIQPANMMMMNDGFGGMGGFNGGLNSGGGFNSMPPPSGGYSTGGGLNSMPPPSGGYATHY